MAHIVTLLDVGGKPTLHINADEVLCIQNRVEATEPVIVMLRGNSVRTGQDVEDVMEIINSGVTPDYDLDENGVLVGYEDPRYVNQRRIEAAETARAAAVEAAKPAASDTGFGAEQTPATDDGKVSFAELKSAKTAFGKSKPK